MKSAKVTIVRIYITEASRLLKPLLNYLRDDAKIRGVSIFRAISGYGDSGTMHEASLIDLSLNLPLTIEFFDDSAKIEVALAHINNIVKREHIAFWDAQANVADNDEVNHGQLR